MNADSQNRLCDIVYEMRGLAATLTAAARGDLQNPSKIIEYAAEQTDRLAVEIVDEITRSSGKPDNSEPI